MSTSYKEAKEVPTETICQRLDELSRAVTKDREKMLDEFTMRVPSELDRDADLVLSEAAARLRLLAEDNAVISVPRHCIPANATLVECYETAGEWVIMGVPPDEDDQGETGHNCDQMGCGSMGHVIARISR